VSFASIAVMNKEVCELMTLTWWQLAVGPGLDQLD